MFARPVRPTARRSAAGALLVLPLAVAIAGCGSSNDTTSAEPPPAAQSSPSAPTATIVKLSADPTGKLAFIPNKFHVKAGRVTFVMTDPTSSGTPHGISIEGNGVDQEGQVTEPGGTSTVTATLEPGEYKIYCPVPGHEDGGMTAKVTVS